MPRPDDTRVGALRQHYCTRGLRRSSSGRGRLPPPRPRPRRGRRRSLSRRRVRPSGGVFRGSRSLWRAETRFIFCSSGVPWGHPYTTNDFLALPLVSIFVQPPKLASLTLSAFPVPPPPFQCGRHTWMPPSLERKASFPRATPNVLGVWSLKIENLVRVRARQITFLSPSLSFFRQVTEEKGAARVRFHKDETAGRTSVSCLFMASQYIVLSLSWH